MSIPAEVLRFEAAIEVSGPFAPTGRIAYQWLPGGEFAVTTHVGPYSTVPDAYERIFSRVVSSQAISLPHRKLIGLPAVEIYRTAKINVAYSLNQTDICLPVATS